MSDKDNKMTLHESAGLLAFGLKTMAGLAPMYYPLMLLNTLITAAQPLIILFFSARILNELNAARDTRTIMVYITLTVGLSFVISVVKALLTREIETRPSYEQARYLIQKAQSEQYASMNFSYTEDSRTNEALAQMDIIARASGRGLIMLLNYPVSIATNLFALIIAVVLLTNASAGFATAGTSIWAAVLFVAFAAGLVMSWFNNKRLAARMREVIVGVGKYNALGDYYNKYVTADQAAKDVRIYDQGSIIRDTRGKSLDTSPWTPFFFFEGRTSGFSMALLSLIAGGFYLISGYNALGGAVPVGSIVQSVGAMMAISGAVGSLAYGILNLWNNASFLKPAKEYFTLPDVLKKGDKPVSGQEEKAHNIEFRNVSFKYPGSDTYALQGLSLSLTPGERLAVVGLNGSGKTTMVKLLCRLYEPTEGEIFLDGTNVSEYDFTQYSGLFSVVFQDYKLFPLNLGQNIAVNEHYDAALVNEVLEKVSFSERLESMPERLDTVLYKDFDEDGTTISGGEAQKLALARALYKSAPIVVLDEPTAALDPLAEYEVYTTFDRTIGGKTALFISHRLSSCRFCHRIAVFDAGRLVQLGSHDDLLRDKNGRYYELWEAQASHYRE